MIHRLFEHVEMLHGKQLVSHALGFITAAKTGMSDAELEDMLSCDDKVVQHTKNNAVVCSMCLFVLTGFS
jgi:hypothetical protein